MPTPHRALGNTIKRARKRAGLTQLQLAAELGVTQPAISGWEKGVSLPETQTRVVLAQRLEIPFAQLLPEFGALSLVGGPSAADIARLIERFSRMSPEARQGLLALAEAASQRLEPSTGPTLPGA